MDKNPPPTPERSILRTERATLQLNVQAPRPTIKAKINEKSLFLFVLDMSALGFVINDDLAKELNLPVIGKAGIGDPKNKRYLLR